jgi:hypothetical protein
MNVRFEYVLDDAGWADAAVVADGEKVSMPVSYLHDSLKQLLEGVAAVVSGGSQESRIVFMGEPGEHWLILKKNEDKAEFEVRRYGDWASWRLSSEEKYICRLSGALSLREFASSVFEAARKVLEEHGVDGYKEKWGRHDFPLEAFESLRRVQNP